jgi:hypothetical protein
MVRNKKYGTGLALVAGLLSLGVNGAAWALPEVEVGTMPPIVAPNVVHAPDSALAEPGSVNEEDATA